MMCTSSLLHRREVLVGLGGLIAAGSATALACDMPRHPPCHAVALVPLTGPLALIGQEMAAGIRAMGDQLREIDPSSRGHLLIGIVDSLSDPAKTVEGIQRMVGINPAPAAIVAADLLLSAETLSRLANSLKIPFISLVTAPHGSPSEWLCQLPPTAMQAAQGLLGYLKAAGMRSDQPINIVYTTSRTTRASEFATAIRASNITVGLQVNLADNSGRDLTPLAADIPRAQKDSAWMVSTPAPAAAPIINLVQQKHGSVPIVVDAGLADPALILRGANAARGLVALSSFSPELIDRRPFLRQINTRVQQVLQRPITPAAALAATAAQVLAEAVVRANVRDNAYAEATRDALRAVSIGANELIMPWESVRFDKESFQNQGARVVALGLREDRVVTMWSG